MAAAKSQKRNNDQIDYKLMATKGVVSKNASKIKEDFDNQLKNAQEAFKDQLSDVELQVEHVKESQAAGKGLNDKQEAAIQEIYLALKMELEKVAKNMENQLKELRSFYEPILEHLANVEQQLDNFEQYSRRNCLLLHGIKEAENENTDNIVIKLLGEKLGIACALEDIERSHRIGSKRSSSLGNSDDQPKCRPIIFKLVSYRFRSEIFLAKKKLKKSGFTITENLTSYRVKILNEAREKFSVRKAWSFDGQIFVAYPDGKKVKILNLDQLKSLPAPPRWPKENLR